MFRFVLLLGGFILQNTDERRSTQPFWAETHGEDYAFVFFSAVPEA